MKLSEISVKEHLKAPHGGRVDQSVLEGWLAAASRRAAIAIGDVHLVVFTYELDQLHAVVVLTTREDQTTPVGYTVLVKRGTYWSVNDVFVDEPFRGRGGAPELYRCLVALGYRLQSGDILSRQAEQVWRKLGAAGRAKVIDLETGNVEDFSDRPMHDKALNPRWRWIAEAALAPEWDRQLIWQDDELLQKWFDGKIDESNCHIRWPGLEN